MSAYRTIVVGTDGSPSAQAAVRWLGGDDSPFAALPAWVAATLAGVGVAFLAVAVLNVFQVREELARIAAATGPNPPAPAPAG